TTGVYSTHAAKALPEKDMTSDRLLQFSRPLVCVVALVLRIGMSPQTQPNQPILAILGSKLTSGFTESL
ncbi:hypothetical protein, partial [Lichenifustis flavocetrariae]